MKKFPLVSIVIPVHNEEKYIAQCIESVLSQTYTNWEGIIVNNCSTDATLDILKRYENLDKRLRIYDNIKYLNQVDNHNEALTKISSSSEYCKMVLGDDFLFPDCLEKMVEVAYSNSAVGIVSSYRLIESNVGNIGLPYGKSVYNGRDICRLHLLDENVYLFGSQTSVMFKSEIVRRRKPFFSGSSMFFDAEVCFDILKDYDFGFIHQILTYTRRNNESEYTSIDKYNPVLIARYLCLLKYGKIYLDDKEYTRKYEDLSRKYYLYLGQKVFTNKVDGFWSYHKNQFLRSALEFNNGKLISGAFRFLIDSIFNPKNTIENMLKKYNEINKLSKH